MKTVFGEPITVGDEIMYVYKSSGIDYICFGKVQAIEVKRIGSFSNTREILIVFKTHEINSNRPGTRYVGKKVRLTWPMAFLCNQEIKTPTVGPL